MKGPKVNITASCSGCMYVNFDYFSQAGWNSKKRCNHPNMEIEPVSTKEHITPDWCPELISSIEREFCKMVPKAAEVFVDKEYSNAD